MNCFAHICIKGSLFGANSSCFIDNYVYYATTLPHRNLSASSKTPLPPLKPLPLLQNPSPSSKTPPPLQNLFPFSKTPLEELVLGVGPQGELRWLVNS